MLIAGFSVFWISSQVTETEQSIKEDVIKEPKEITTSKKDPIIADELASQILLNCGNEIECTLNSFRDIEDDYDVNTVLSTFNQLIELYSKNGVDCHRTAHHLGMFLYPYVGKNLLVAYDFAGQKCGGAIFHGIIQNYFVIQKNEGIDPDTINISDICPKFEENPYEIKRWQCLHGLGHGLTISYNYDIFSAVKRCDVFEPGWEQISCGKGIFMQNIIKYSESREGNFDENNILYPCNEIDDKYTPQCYQYHTTYLLFQNNGSIMNSFADCDKIESEEFVKYCYHGMGRQMLPATEVQIEKINRFCQLGGQEQYYTDCFRGMVMTLVNNDQGPSLGFRFCEIIPDNSKTDCYDALGKWIIMLYPEGDQRTKACSNVDELVYFQTCINASLEGIRLL